uniref:CCHC-type domain-containing protein n=1 Tax=Cannabis sativa TaxID=3483 RepID=A0A803P1F1_CANSA
MEDLAKSFSAALHLTDTENTIHSLAEHVDPNEGLPPAPPQFHLMATLFTTKNFNHNALKTTEKHRKGWLPIPDTDSTLSPETMRKIPFWVQIHNIPFSRRSISLAKLLGQITGTLLEIHQPSLLETWGSYMRVRIMFDVTKPLPRGIPIVFPGLASPTWLELKYEDIPDHCYYCGRLGHSYPSCTEYMRASDESTQPPPLPYENVLRGTSRPNHGPFGILPNPLIINSPTIRDGAHSGPHGDIPSTRRLLLAAMMCHRRHREEESIHPSAVSKAVAHGGEWREEILKRPEDLTRGGDVVEVVSSDEAGHRELTSCRRGMSLIIWNAFGAWGGREHSKSLPSC